MEGRSGIIIGHDVVVVGASSGGVEALLELASGLPADLPAALLVVVHIPQEAPSALPRVLDRAGPLQALHPEDGEPVEPGRIYVAPPNFHLLLEDSEDGASGPPLGRVRLGRGPKENHHRPAVDPLFRSAAIARGERVVGVILSGARDDGAAGLRAVKQRGGVAVVQDPEEALFPGMPESALLYADADHSVPLKEMASLLDRACREPAGSLARKPSRIPSGATVTKRGEGGAYAMVDDMEFEAKIAGLDPSVVDGDGHVGELSGFTCPDCTGPLFEIRDGDLDRFRCRVGHAYTAQSVLDGKSAALENALYTALNTLEESAGIADRLADRAGQRGSQHARGHFEERAQDTRRRATVIRRVLTGAPDAVWDVSLDDRRPAG